jgi:hypothetical protein
MLDMLESAAQEKPLHLNANYYRQQAEVAFLHDIKKEVDYEQVPTGNYSGWMAGGCTAMGNCKSLVIIPRGMTMMFFVSIQ